VQILPREKPCNDDDPLRTVTIVKLPRGDEGEGEDGHIKKERKGNSTRLQPNSSIIGLNATQRNIAP